MGLTVRPITAAEHLAWIAAHGPVSFLQTPAWGGVKSEWSSESVGWFADDAGAQFPAPAHSAAPGADDAGAQFPAPGGSHLIGTALILYRSVPVIGATLAYVPEGPTWTIDDPATLASALDALADHVAARRAFALTVGPTIWWRRWHAATVKAALAGPATRFAEVDPDEVNPTAPRLAAALSAQGWRPPEVQNGFGAGQPDYVFQLPLAGRDEAQILAGFNQLWRRNIRKAEAAGVEVTRGARADFPAFHALYQETAARDHFTPRPLAYFEGMWDHQTAEDPDRLGLYLARQGETLVAAAVTARVPGQTWYVYGASATEYRDVRGSNALQWAMVRDAIVHEDALYDLRGITDTTDRADPHAGLLQFKVGSGGRAQQYLGEWTKVIRPLVYRAYRLAMASRG